MLRKYFNQTLFFLVWVLAVPLQAAHYPAQDQDKKDNSQNPAELSQEKEKLEKFLKIHERRYGADHPHTATVMENLGNRLIAKINFDKNFPSNSRKSVIPPNLKHF